MKNLLLILLFPTFLVANPWGKDADLLQKQYELKMGCCEEPPPSNRGPLGILMKGIICFHQTFTSPACGPQSHHYPSSSNYMRLSIERYGFLQGYFMGCDRLMRENSDPWIYKPVKGFYGNLKHDPVP